MVWVGLIAKTKISPSLVHTFKEKLTNITRIVTLSKHFQSLFYTVRFDFLPIITSLPMKSTLAISFHARRFIKYGAI